MPFDKMAAFTFQFTGQDDTPDWTPTETRTNFDSRGNDLKTFVDALVDAMNSTADGVSGADKLGMTAITGLSGTTPQAIVEDLKNYLDTGFYTKTGTYTKAEVDALINAVALGQVPDGSLTDAKLSNDAGAIKNRIKRLQMGVRI